MSGAKEDSAIDLERELSCSICTDVFFQPLTLLDCLHTFCGSCLKEWFSWQATSATHNSRVATPYTCPSCRATVRAARPNANVTTLLDMYLQANPSKGKTEQEKAEMRQNYRPGDDVIPPVEVHTDSEDSEDERMLDQVRQMSVADVNPAVEANRRADRATRHRRQREGNRDSRRRDAAEARRRQEAVERNVAHQPSLRSLLSASGEDSAEVQQEILSSILSSGLLDGIDVDNLTAEQEDELAERITEAYHRRHAARARDHHLSEAGAQSRPSTGERARASAQPTPPRSRPHASRPHLIDQWTQDTSHGTRRVPEQRPIDPSNTQPATAAVVQPPTIRSATDPAARHVDRNETSERRRRADPPSRSNTDTSSALPYPRSTPDAHRDGGVRRSVEPRTSHFASTTYSNTPPYPVAPTVNALQSDQPRVAPSQDSPSIHTPLSIPTVTCDRCGKADIEHDLHYHCSKCSNGKYDICLRCYRTGQGCNHWFGFGYMALTRWQRNAPPGGYPPDYELPHVLAPRRYVKRSPEQGVMEDTLQEGAFCEECFQYADQSYWHCNTCFEGAWGFCSACVQQARHCTHPLAPFTRISDRTRARNAESDGLRQIPLPHLPMDSYYFDPTATYCAVCNANIPPDHTRLHCAQCNNGNYDICNDSYHSLEITGKIGPGDGLSGGRRCLQGHLMAVVVYCNLAEGIQQRVIVSEPVGGWQAKHKPGPVTPRAPSVPQSDKPSNMRALALWSWWPAEGVEDELAFPKFAELREVEKINIDYCIGVYARTKGLFPANHVRIL